MADNRYQPDISKILNLTLTSVEDITSVWIKTFDQEMCNDNLRRLYDHAKNFYADLLHESIEKKSLIEDEIQTLRLEAESLRRLLHTNIEMPQVLEDDEVPLLVRQKEMDKSLSELREKLRRRREEICELLLEQESLCDELEETKRQLLDDPLPTAEELDDFRNYLESLKEERDKRMQDFIQLRREIRQYLKILELNVNTETDDRLLNQHQIKLSMENYDSLKNMRDRYADQVKELEALIDDVRQKLPPLWMRLNTPYEERQKVERYTEVNQTTYEVLCMELERCENIKRQNLQQYIQKIRLEIEIWWDKTLKSDIERKRFEHFNLQIYTDELLTLHEMELDDLKQYYENNEKIFELYNDRKMLWERMCALEEKACDPGRYNNRGGKLLKEEKERKIIATKLPKIEQQIRELVMEYMQREHAPFLVHGDDILEVMEAEWKKKREDKEAHSNARKNAVTMQAHVVNRSHTTNTTRTPLMQRATSALNLCKTPSSTNTASSKRPNLTTGAQKRKLNPSEKTTPNAKRSLWKSPFLKPAGPVRSCVKQNAIKTTNVQKRPPRVIGTTLRRRSGRLSASGSIIKRKSINKNISHNLPKITVTDVDSTDEENYDVFKNSIEPASRSSTQHESMNKRSTNITKRVMREYRQKLKLMGIDEKNQRETEFRLATLPKPQIITTPSKQSARDFPISPGASSSSILNGNRKLTTKNIPILF